MLVILALELEESVVLDVNPDAIIHSLIVLTVCDVCLIVSIANSVNPTAIQSQRE